MRSLLKKIGEFLVAVGSASPSSTRRAGGATIKPASQFETRMKKMLSERASSEAPLVAGSVQLLGLQEIREAVGSDWHSVADKAYAVVERVIEHHLGPTDLCARHGEETYVICFAELGKAEAQAKTRVIVEGARDALLAEVPAASKIVFRQSVTTIDSTSEKLKSGSSILGSIVASLDEVRREHDEIAEQQRCLLLEQARLAYAPVWVPSKDSVMLYRCCLDDATSRTTLRNLTLLTEPEILQQAVCELDYVILGHGIRMLHDGLKAASKTVLIVPVHFQSLSHRAHKEAYLALCRKVPEAYGRFIIFEIYGAPKMTAPARLAEIVQTIRQGRYSVVISLADRPADPIALFSIVGLYGVSVDLDSFSEKDLPELAKHARARGLRVFGHSAKNFGALKAAIEAGFDFLDGEAVSARVDQPRGAYRWKPSCFTEERPADLQSLARSAPPRPAAALR